jgi:hypothetical protein
LVDAVTGAEDERDPYEGATELERLHSPHDHPIK